MRVLVKYCVSTRAIVTFNHAIKYPEDFFFEEKAFEVRDLWLLGCGLNKSRANWNEVFLFLFLFMNNAVGRGNGGLVSKFFYNTKLQVQFVT